MRPINNWDDARNEFDKIADRTKAFTDFQKQLKESNERASAMLSEKWNETEHSAEENMLRRWLKEIYSPSSEWGRQQSEQARIVSQLETAMNFAEWRERDATTKQLVSALKSLIGDEVAYRIASEVASEFERDSTLRT